jgi:hypothetical protein
VWANDPERSIEKNDRVEISIAIAIEKTIGKKTIDRSVIEIFDRISIDRKKVDRSPDPFF